MNLNDPQHPWTRLNAAARTISDDRDTAAPYGFTTRVAALAFVGNRAGASLFERFAWRALGVAGLLALASIAVNFSALKHATSVDEEQTDDSPISLLLTVD